MEARTGSHDKKYPERETRRGSSDLKLASAGRGGEGLGNVQRALMAYK